MREHPFKGRMRICSLKKYIYIKNIFSKKFNSDAEKKTYEADFEQKSARLFHVENQHQDNVDSEKNLLFIFYH